MKPIKRKQKAEVRARIDADLKTRIESIAFDLNYSWSDIVEHALEIFEEAYIQDQKETKS